MNKLFIFTGPWFKGNFKIKSNNEKGGWIRWYQMFLSPLWS